MHSLYLTVALSSIAFLLQACAPSELRTASPPTPDTRATETGIAVSIFATLTASAPTASNTPTMTVTPTRANTPTVKIASPTATGTLTRAATATMVRATTAPTTPAAVGLGMPVVTRSPLTLQNEQLIVRYPSEDPRYQRDAEKVFEYGLFARQAVASQYPHELTVPFTIQLFDLAHWTRQPSSADADSTNLLIRFLAPSDQPTNYRSWDDDTWYLKNVVHEYTHIAVNRDFRNRGSAPQWFSEGFAEYIAIFHSTPEVLRKYDANLQRVRDMIGRDEGRLLQVSDDIYYGGALIVKYMDEVYGRDRLIAVIKSDAPSFWEAVKRELRVSLDVFEDNWIEWATPDHLR